MKRLTVLLTLILSYTLFYCTPVMAEPDIKGEKIFLKHGNQCLDIMKQAAQEMGVKGVAVIAYIPGENSSEWISKMKVAGALSNASASFLAIAYSKAAEMADTFKDSGSGTREPLHGEFGYQGGIIRKVESGYILAVFSGASGEQDAEIATGGVTYLMEYY